MMSGITERKLKRELEEIAAFDDSVFDSTDIFGDDEVFNFDKVADEGKSNRKEEENEQKTMEIVTDCPPAFGRRNRRKRDWKESNAENEKLNPNKIGTQCRHSIAISQ